MTTSELPASVAPPVPTNDPLIAALPAPAGLSGVAPGMPAAAFTALRTAGLVLDRDGRILELNPAAAALFNRPAARLIGRILWHELPAWRDSVLEHECQRALTERLALECEEFCTEIGRWLRIEISPWQGGVALLARDITERRQLDQSQRQALERLRRALANSTITLYEQDRELRYTWLHPIHPEHAAAFGKTDAQLDPHGSGELLMRWKQHVLTTGAELRREIRSDLPTGSHHYDVLMAPNRNANGEIVGIIGAAVDITARKRAERELRESEARFQATLDNSSAVIFLKDREGRFLLTNRQHERLLGRTRSEIVGRSVHDVYPPDVAQQHEADDRAVMAAGRALEFEETVPTTAGPRTFLAIKFPLKDTTGNITGIGGIATDITERKTAAQQQQALYDLVARVNRAAALPEIYDAALDAICACVGTRRASILLYDADDVMRFKAWRGLSDGYRAAVEGHSPWRRDETEPTIVTVEDIDTFPLEAELRATIKSEGIHACAFIPLTFEQRLLGKFMVYFGEPHAFRPDELRAAQTVASQVAFAIERQRGANALERLVDERTASLRLAIAQMEEFSYSVSHDLRAPLRALQGYATALIEDYGERLDDQARDYLQRISRNSVRMDRLIQDLLTYSRLSRRSDLELRPVQLPPLIREIVQQYPEMRAEAADIVIAEPLLPVLGHEPSLTQILSNLLTNAVKFVAPGVRPCVRIRTESRDGQVQLWVEDNGIGVKLEHQHRLFGLFERVHPEKRFEGTGIGLAIVRKAAERMGGKAGVESDGAQGSRFWVSLPAAR